jgi:hypothetical protein
MVLVVEDVVTTHLQELGDQAELEDQEALNLLEMQQWHSVDLVAVAEQLMEAQEGLVLEELLF